MLAGAVVEELTALSSMYPTKMRTDGTAFWFRALYASFGIQCRLAGSCVSPIRVWFTTALASSTRLSQSVHQFLIRRTRQDKHETHFSPLLLSLTLPRSLNSPLGSNSWGGHVVETSP